MNVLKSFKQVSTFVFDVDGVLTDGSVLLLDNGLQARTMQIKDGLALQMALRNGYRVVVLSGGNSEPVRQRMAYLGINDVELGVKSKSAFLEQYTGRHGLKWEEILFMGDDLPDVALLQKVGLPACPADAVPEVKKCCRYISPLGGGMGCVRDVIEKVLKISGKWQYGAEVVSR